VETPAAHRRDRESITRDLEHRTPRPDHRPAGTAQRRRARRHRSSSFARRHRRHHDPGAPDRPVTDEATRRHLLSIVTRVWRRERELERFVAGSPLVDVAFDEEGLIAA
jgi:hypothetical protein